MLETLRQWLFPPACVACETPGPALCAACAPAPDEAIAFAIGGLPALALGRYEGALRRAIVAMKHGERDPLDAFAGLLAARAPFGAAVIPVPTTRGRILDRGFDQSVELARRVAAQRGARCCEVLEKRGDPQAGLDRRGRLRAAGRYRVRGGVPLPATATLLDDVCTTGATVRDAARVLRDAGVEVSRVVVLARTAEPTAAAAGR